MGSLPAVDGLKGMNISSGDKLSCHYIKLNLIHMISREIQTIQQNNYRWPNINYYHRIMALFILLLVSLLYDLCLKLMFNECLSSFQMFQ